MSATSFDTALRNLALWRSRRAALGSIAAIAISAVATVSEAKKRDRKKKKKSKSGKNTGKIGSCTNNYSEQQILDFIAKAAK